MPRKRSYEKRKDIWKYYKVEYTSNYTEEMDTEGLKVLKWSMFDSPDKLGSGKYFMESEPVFILDEIFRKERLSGFILQGYVSKTYGDRIAILENSDHRVGKSIKFKFINKIKK